MAKGIVAVVGRPNVGKSTFFNKLTGERISIVDDTPGVTRDRISADVEWNGRVLTLVDTGGIEPETNSALLRQMRAQAEMAIAAADVILFLTDLRTGVTDADREIATMLRKSKKPVLPVVNKVDAPGDLPADFYEFYSLGLGDPLPVSSIHGTGCGDEAAQDSAQVVAILEKFLRSGVDPAVAMKILNSVLLLRSGDSWGYATVDLMCVDLFTGETCFYKYGAAPSYVKSGKSIRRIKCETLAAGISMGAGIAPDTVRMRLRPGSTAVIATDGVIVDAEDEWLKQLLNKGFDDMKALARATLKEAESRYGVNDDMTVVTVRVEERA